MSKRPYNIYQSDESFDILAELDDLDFDGVNYQKGQLQDLVDTDCKQETPPENNAYYSNGLQRNGNSQQTQNNGQNSFSNCFPTETYDSQNSSNNRDQRNNQSNDNPKHDKGKQYSKNYREKKKENLKGMQQQNKFLKQKIEDLSFRLRQTQLELNKLKHSQFNRRQNVQTIKQQYMKEIDVIFQNKEENKQKIIEMEKKFTYLNTLSSKEKMDLLDYYRNQFFEILVSDLQFYLLDGTIENRGLSRNSEDSPPRQIDLEIYEIYNIQTFEQLQRKRVNWPPYAVTQIKKYKQCIQTLYQDYCKVITQGRLVEKMWQPQDSEMRQSKVCSQTENFLKLQIFFEKVKYRKDMRELRESWFVDPEKQAVRKRGKSNTKKSKND